MLNKKAMGDRLLFFIFFLIIGIIAMGIVIGTYQFFGKSGYDSRQDEANILYEKIVDCLEKTDPFTNQETFLQECKLNKQVLEKDHLVYIKNQEQEFFIGIYDFKTQCFLDERLKKTDLPLCKDTTLSINGKEYYILVGSRQDSRRVLND